jgi:hydroxymethylpyrimidine/phosphomethylpyrimidine kinase
LKKKSILLIAGSDSSAGAGIQADLKTLTFFKVYAATVFTALTAQNTKGVQKVLNIPPRFIEEQIKCISEDLDIAFIKIGMLSNKSIIKTINYCLEKYLPSVPIILDPVMVAKGGYNLLEKSAINYLKKTLIVKSFLITPNTLEAEKILNCKLNSIDEVLNCKKAFMNIGAKHILLKGGHMLEDNLKITDILFNNGKTFKFINKRIKTKNTHGTGCSLASAITANLLLGKSLINSVKISINYVQNGIKNGYQIGEGHNPINHFANFQVKV